MTEPVFPSDPSAIEVPWPLRHRVVRVAAVWVLLGACASGSFAAMPASPRPTTTWGAIAARADGHGYAFNQPSRAAAEQVARAQCERPAGRPATAACEVRVWFENACGALATGNFGEWGAATGADRTAAAKAAVSQCDAHLPTEPCRAVVSVCSLP